MIKDKSKMLFTGRQIAAIILPLLLQNLLSIAIGMADSVMVSNKGETTFAGKSVLFMRPQTFMNLSGEAIREAADFYKVPSDNIIIIYDDVSFDPGTMRIKRKGSAGGHNGIKNIILQLDTDVFPRIKLGVGIKPKDYDMVDWVLGKLPPDTHKDFFSTLEKTPEALELIISGNLDKAMNQFN